MLRRDILLLVVVTLGAKDVRANEPASRAADAPAGFERAFSDAAEQLRQVGATPLGCVGQAAENLASRAGPDAAEFLRSRAAAGGQEPGPALSRRLALTTLARIADRPAAQDALTALLSTQDAGLLREVVWAIPYAPPSAARSLAAQGAAALPSEDARAQCIAMLGALGGGESRDILADLVRKDLPVRLRTAAEHALRMLESERGGQSDADQAARVERSMLYMQVRWEQDERMRQSASGVGRYFTVARDFQEQYGPVDNDFLVLRLEEGDPLAAAMMYAQGDDACIPHLLRFVGDPDVLGYACIEALGGLGRSGRHPEAIRAIESLISPENESLSNTAVRLLAKCGDEQTLERLGNLISDDRYSDLFRQGLPRQVEFLERRLHPGSPPQ